METLQKSDARRLPTPDAAPDAAFRCDVPRPGFAVRLQMQPATKVWSASATRNMRKHACAGEPGGRGQRTEATIRTQAPDWRVVQVSLTMARCSGDSSSETVRRPAQSYGRGGTSSVVWPFGKWPPPHCCDGCDCCDRPKKHLQQQ